MTFFIYFYIRAKKFGLGRQIFFATIVALLCAAYSAGAQTCITAPSGLVSWWSAENNYIDNVGGNDGINAGPSAFTAGKDGLAFLSDTNHYIQVLDAPNLRFTNAMTLEAWIFPATYASSSSYILCKYNSTTASNQAGPNQSSWALGLNPNGQGLVLISTNGAVTAASAFTTSICPTNVWTHLAATYDGSNLKIYFNGQLQTSISQTGNIFPGLNNLGIGANVGNIKASQIFSGLIDEPSVYSRALSGAEIQSIYNADSAGKCGLPLSLLGQPSSLVIPVTTTATFNVHTIGTPPLVWQWYFNNTSINGATNSTLVLPNTQLNQAGNYSVIVSNTITGAFVTTTNAALGFFPCSAPASNIVSWWAAEGNALDSISTNHGVFVGSPAFPAGKVGSAFSFDGASQFVRVPDSPAFHFTNKMTVEAWVYPTAYNTQSSSILSKYTAPAGTSHEAWWLSLGPSGVVGMSISANGTSTAVQASDSVSPCPLNTWSYVAATYDGTNVQIFVNGSPAAPAAFSGPIFPSTNDIGIGATIGGVSNGLATGIFSGLIDEPTLYNRALSVTEIQSIYAAEIFGKCPLPPAFRIQPADVSAPVTGQAVFTAGVTGSQPLFYQWYFNGVSLSGATNSTLVLSHLQTNQTGIYFVSVSNAAVGAAINSSNATLNVSSTPPCFPPPANIVSWWTAEGNALDNAGTNNGTLVGSPTFSTGEVGNAFSFNGSSQFVRVTNSATLQFSNAMTVEAWVFPAAYNSQTSAILSKFDATGGINQASWAFYISPDGHGEFAISTTGINPAATVLSTDTCPLNTWTHLAATYDGTNLQLYLNGALQGSVSQTGNIFPGNDDLGIGVKLGGVDNGSVQSVFSGKVDEPALYNRALAAPEIASIYNAGNVGKCPIPPAFRIQPASAFAQILGQAVFNAVVTGSQPIFYQWYFNGTNISGATGTSLTIPIVQTNQAGIYFVSASNASTGITVNSSNVTLTILPASSCFPPPANMVSWWTAEGNALDNAGTNNGTLVGSPTFVAGKVGRAFNFSGNGQFVRVSNSLSLQFSRAMTAEAWVFPTARNNQASAILSKFDGTGGINQASWAFYISPDGHGEFAVSTTGIDPAATVFSTNTCPLNIWTHLAATYDGTNLQIYINGSLQGVASMSGNIFPGNDDLGIGVKLGSVDNNAVQSVFAGEIDEPAIYNRALAAAEIASIYNANVSGKCPLPPTISQQPVDQQALPGRSAVFSAGVSGTPPVTVQWYFNGSAITGATATVLTLTNIQSGQLGNYSLIASNSATGAFAVSSNAALTFATCFSAISSGVSWWSAENNAGDNLGLNPGTLVGNPAFASGEFGQAFSFNGSSQFVRVANSASLQFSNALTAEAWIFPTSYNNRESSVISKFDAISDINQSSWNLFVNSDGRGAFQLSLNGSLITATIFTTNVCPLNAWTHLAATYDSTNLQIYFNGSLHTTAGVTGNIFHGADDVGIGAKIGGVANNAIQSAFSGLIDEPAVYSSALSPLQLQIIYIANKCPIAPTITTQPVSQLGSPGYSTTFSVAAAGNPPVTAQWYFNGAALAGATNFILALTNVQSSQFGNYSVIVSNSATGAFAASSNAALIFVPCYSTSSNLVSWWPAEGTTADNLGLNPGVWSDTPAYVAGQVGQAFSFNGSSRFIRVPNSPSLQFSNAMTAEAWVFPTAYNSQSSAVLSKFDAAGSINQASWAFYIAPDGRGQFAVSTDGANANANVFSTSVCPLNAWTHLAATYDGASLRIYFNGSLQNTVPLSGNIFRGRDDLGIGAKLGGVGNGSIQSVFTGIIDEPAVYNAVLTPTNIQNIHAAGKCFLSPMILSQPVSATNLPGTQVTFNISAIGSQPLAYQWYFNGTNISGATASSLLVPNLQPAVAGGYTVVITNFGGIVTSSTAGLVVLPPPTCISTSSDIAGWWPFESNAVDNIAGHDGNSIGPVAFVPGEVGNALALNSNAFIRVSDAPDLRFTNAMTVEAWIYPTAYNSQSSAVVSKYDAGGGIYQASWVFYITPDGHAEFVITTNGGDPTATAVSTNICPLNGWTHVAGTYDGTNLLVYLNGFLQGAVVTSGNIFPGSDDVGIGAKLGGVGDGSIQSVFSGLIDEPAVYRRALSNTEILGIFFADFTGKCLPALPPVITSVQPALQKVTPGTSVTFTSSFTGSPSLGFQWKFDGANIPGATSRTLIVPNVTTANAGNYSLFISNSINSALSSNVVLEVVLAFVYGNDQPLLGSQYNFTNSVNITLADFFPHGFIFYTLDGTTPTPDSALYTGPFAISNDCVIQTLGFDADFIQSAVSDPIGIHIIGALNLAVTTPGGGTVLIDPSSPGYSSNTVVTVTAIPASGWKFLQWLGDLSGTNRSGNVIIDRNKSVRAIFGTAVTNLVGGNGSISFNPPGNFYPFGTVLQVTAIPQSGNFFVFWGDSASGTNNPLVFPVTSANPTISALFFALNNGQVALSVVPVGHGTVSINPAANTYATGQSVTITANPDSGKSFLGWSGDASGTNNPLKLQLGQSKTIYANFSTNNSLVIYPIAPPDDGVIVDLIGELGTHYRLDASSNLVDWLTIYDVTNSVGTLHYIDFGVTNLDQRFYRALSLP